MSGSGISWAVCKSAPRSRQITTPAPHCSVFMGRMPFLPPNQQCQSTEGKKIVRYFVNRPPDEFSAVRRLQSAVRTATPAFSHRPSTMCHNNEAQTSIRYTTELSQVSNSLPITVLSSDSVAVFKSRLKAFLFSQTVSYYSAH